MDKRTKILLSVLVTLLLVAGGYYGYIFMTAEKPGLAAKAAPPIAEKRSTPPAATQAPQEAPVIQVSTAAPAAVPVTPATAAVRPMAKPASPSTAVPAVKAGAPAAKPVGPATAAPAAKQGKPAAKPVAPATTATAGKPGAPGAKPAPTSAYVPSIKVVEKGKPVQYNSPEEFVGTTKMSPEDIRAFSKKGLEDAKKAYDALKAKGAKVKVGAEELGRAEKDLEMMEKLASIVNAKFPEKPAGTGMMYSALGKRDPFMSPLDVPKILPRVLPSAPPLERFPTESMQVRAIVWNKKGFRALIETQDRRGYTVKVGDTLGNKKGKIVKITEKRVYVVEKITDILGDVETRNIVLKLYKEKEAK